MSVLSTYPITQFSINARSKSIDLHFIRQRVAIGDVHVLHVPTTSQFADIFTKRLPTFVFSEFRSSLNVYTIDVLTVWGGVLVKRPDPKIKAKPCINYRIRSPA
jgi:hypothetical protein